MNACDDIPLSAYLDDELDPAARRFVANHIRNCPRCAAEFDAIREASQFVAQFQFHEITAPELRRAHDAIEQAAEGTADSCNWRLYAGLSAVAASVLIVSASWLAALPEPQPAMARDQSPAPEWEQVATNLRVDPVSQTDQTEQFANARITDWMIDALNGSKQ